MITSEINFAHLCDMAFLSNTGKLNIIGIFENINIRKVPFKYSRITLVMNLALEKGKHSFKLRIAKVDTNTELAKIEGEINSHHGGPAGVINEFIDLVFNETGAYQAEIWIDNEPIKSIKFIVNITEK